MSNKYIKINNEILLNKAKEYGKTINKSQDEIIESALAFYFHYQAYLINDIVPAHEKVKKIALQKDANLLEKLTQIDALYYEKTGIYFPNFHNHCIQQKKVLLDGEIKKNEHEPS